MWLDKLLMSLSRKITLVASQSNKPSHCLIGNVITIFCLLAVPLDKVMSCIGQPLCRAARHFRKNGNQSGRIGSKFCWEIFWDGHYDDEQEAKRLEKIINVSWEIREFLHFYHNSDFRLPTSGPLLCSSFYTVNRKQFFQSRLLNSNLYQKAPFCRTALGSIWKPIFFLSNQHLQK